MNFRYTTRNGFFLALIVLACSWSQQALNMSNRPPTHRVCAPLTRLFYPRFSPNRDLHDRLYFDTKINGQDHYQICQVLYGEEISFIRDGNLFYIEGPGQKTGYVKPESLQIIPVKDGFDGEKVIVTQPQANALHLNEIECELSLPMGSILRVKECKLDDYFEFFDPLHQLRLIRKSDVISITQLKSYDEQTLRKTIVEQAKKLIGFRYQWGGQSKGGSDCSGLIHTVYQSCNHIISRDVPSIFRKSHSIEPHMLQPGDLIFFYRPVGREKVVDHVVLYEGEDLIIEASPTAQCVIRSTFEQEFGKPIRDCKNDDEFLLYGDTYRIACKSILKKR